MTEQVQLELVRQLPVILAAVFSFVASVLTVLLGRSLKKVKTQLNSVLHEDRAIAQAVSDDKAVAAHAAGVKEEQEKHGQKTPLQP